MYTVKATSSDNYNIICLIFGDVVRFVIMDLSNHTIIIVLCFLENIYSMCSLAVSTQDSPAVEP